MSTSSAPANSCPKYRLLVFVAASCRKLGAQTILVMAGYAAAGATTDTFRVYVATNGDDGGLGSISQPFATLERARDAVRVYVQNGFLPPGGAIIEVAGGRYEMPRTLDLNALDTGTAASPILWRAAPGAEVRISGGRIVNGFSLVSDAPTLARLDASAQGHVWAANLPAQGITNYSSMQAGSAWAQSDPGLEVFFNDRPAILARWPNEGYTKIVNVLGPTPLNVRGTTGTVEGIILYGDDRPSRWVGQPEIMVHGFWFWDWADQRQRVQSIDTTNHILAIAAPYHTYGYRPNRWYYAFNLLPELDKEGEWYLDRSRGMLFFWPPGPLTNGAVMVSALNTLMTISNASFLTFEGFTFEGSQRTALTVTGGATNTFRACTFRNLGKTGLSISSSPGSGVTGAHLYFCGDSGVSLSGGTRSTLTPGGLYVEHSHLHHWSRWNPVYHAGITVSGVGNHIAHNSLHDAPHEGIGFGGNDHVIEYNEFHDLVNESNDAGVIYSGRTWSTRGHIIRYNYFHHVYGFNRAGANCVYLDDQFSSAIIYGNLFYKVPNAVELGGGRDNYVNNNIFIECGTSISLDARGLGWASSTFTTLSNELVALPYKTPPWSVRYPELTNIFNENCMAPHGNIFGTNISWASGWTSIESAAQPGVKVTNNLVATDPLFVDTNHLNFALKTNSPALALGFQALPLAQIGPDTNMPHAPWLPTLTLVQPLHRSVFALPATVPIEAVLSDPARIAGGVNFFAGNALLATVSNGPLYSFAWSNPPANTFTLRAEPAAVSPVPATLNNVIIRLDDGLITYGSLWKYLDNGSNPGTAWRGNNFNDTAWKSGLAELGYGDISEGRPEKTVISYGPNSNAKYITYYFRRAFSVVDPARYTNLVIGLMRDDGGIVYLNSNEVFRSNMPPGAAVSYTTQAASAVSGTDEATFFTTNVTPSFLRAGINVLAVEIHQSTNTSTDVSFDLYLLGQVPPASPRLVSGRAGSALNIEWSLDGSDYTLEAAASLMLNDWQPASAMPVIANGAVRVRLPLGSGSAFYRLKKW